MMHGLWKLQRLMGVLAVTSLLAVVPQVGWAQQPSPGSSVPPQANPGLILRHEQIVHPWRQWPPMLYQVVPDDRPTGTRFDTEPLIRVMPGVLPDSKSVEGQLVQPNTQPCPAPQTQPWTQP